MAQGEVLPAGDGSHLFRRIVNDAINLQPDSNNLQALESLDQLSEQPENTLLIVLGKTDVLDRLPFLLDDFLRLGGAALIATDRDADQEALKSLGVSVIGKPVQIDPNSEYAWLGFADCIYVQSRDAGQPVFKRLKKVTTNIAGHLRLKRDGLPVWAAFPSASTVEGRPAPFLQSFRFAAGGAWDKGRVLVLSDHSVFINAMLWQEGIDNLAFTYNCINWLTEAGKRNRVLFIEEGTPQTRFDIPLKELPLPPVEAIVRAVNTGLRGMEEENRLNILIHEAVGRINYRPFMRTLLALSVLAIGVIGLIWLSLAKHHWEAGTPVLESGLAQLVPSVHVVDQRHRMMLREGNFWEVARDMARQGLEPIFGAPLQGQPTLPNMRISGNWQQAWRLRRQVKRLWRLAYADAPRRMTAKKLTRLRAEIDAVKTAFANGSLQVDDPRT
jgi:hypothetical protein